MDDYIKSLIPKSLLDFEKMFSTEEQCVEYLIKMKYGSVGYRCSKCDNNNYWLKRKYVLKCSKCFDENSILNETIFQSKSKPLMLYFRAIWYIVGQKNGTNATSIKSILSLGSYRSAWLWLHKIRRAMIRLDREKLNGNVEVDETQFGKTTNNKRGRGTNQLKLIVAVELRYKSLGKIRIKTIEDFSSYSLQPFILSNIEKGSNIITDDWNGYNGIEKEGYTREIHESKNADTELQHVHLIISLLKRWILGTLHGSYSDKYFDYYLEEFVFRFNRRKSKDRGLLFYRLMEVAVNKFPTTLDEIKDEKRAHSDQESSSENNIPNL